MGAADAGTASPGRCSGKGYGKGPDAGMAAGTDPCVVAAAGE
jgi:hypothetical protein